MTPANLIFRNLRRRRLSSTLLLLNVALGVMLVVTIMLVRSDLEDSYKRPGQGFAFVVGSPKGSSLEIVLNTIFHRGVSQSLLPYSTWKELAGDRLVALAVPYALGDSFRGYRVVGTTEDVFSPRFPAPQSGTVEGKFASGGPFRCDPDALDAAVARLLRAPMKPEWESAPEVYEAVLGHEVAKSLKLSVGDMIEPSHGIEGARLHGERQLWRVTGVLKESRTPVDRVVYINMDSFYRIPEHAGGLSMRPDGLGMDASVSSIVLFPAGGVNKVLLNARLQVRQDVRSVEVGSELNWLWKQVGRADTVLTVVAAMVVAIGVVSILVAIYNTMNERRREIAILRALGARRTTILAIIVGEATVLAFLGAVLGAILSRGLLAGFGGVLEAVGGLRPDPVRILLPEEPLLILLVAAVGALAGLVPAVAAYRTDVAGGLAPQS